MAEVNASLEASMARAGYMPASVAALKVGVSLSTVYRAVERGALEGFRAGDTGLWFVRRRSLAAHYGPQVSAVTGLDVLLLGEDPDAPPLSGAPLTHRAPVQEDPGKTPAPKTRAKTPAPAGKPRKTPSRPAPGKGKGYR